MAKLTKNQEAIKLELDRGRTIAQYDTGNRYGYDSYFRWTDTLEVVPSKTIVSMRRKGIEIDAPLVKGVIVKYDPYNEPKKIYVEDSEGEEFEKITTEEFYKMPA